MTVHFSMTALLALALLSVACAPAAPERSAPAPQAPQMTVKRLPVVLAPGLEGGAAWLNAEQPVKLSDLRGHVVVLDFWTYCCINCLHVLPELERVEREFKDDPVHVIGVHSGKFDAEKDAARIKTAMDRHGVAHPVVVDSSFAIWKRFEVQGWPTLVIIGPEGDIAARFSGEPKRGAVAERVKRLLEEGKRRGTLARVKKAIPAPPRGNTGPLAYPGKVAVAPNGDIAVADSSHHRIVILNEAGEVKDVAGSGFGGWLDGRFELAAFRYPQGMVFGDDGVLYVADTENHTVRALHPGKRIVATLAGTGDKGVGRKGGGALITPLRSPWALAKRGSTLFVAMAGSHQIWTLDLDRFVVQPLAGSGAENIDDGAFDVATFSQPSGLALSGDVLYVADSEVSAIRAVNLSEKRVRTLVGTGLFDFGDEDGVGKKARLQHALGVVSRGEQLFIADTFNNKLKVLDPKTRRVKTLAAGLAEPGGLALMRDGRILIADTNHHRLRTFDPVSGALGDFPIVGLEPPASRGLVLAEGGTGGPPPRLSVKASGKLGKRGAIVIEPRAPSGAKLTDGAPVVAEIDEAASGGLAFESARHRRRVQGGSGVLRIPVSVTAPAAKAVIEVSFFWCTTGDEQACYPAVATLDIQLDVGSDDRGDARIVFAATR